MKIVQVQLSGSGFYSQNGPILSEKKNKEGSEAYELRTWPERQHHKNNQVYIPAMALRHALAECAKYLSLSIPGKGKSTFTKNFEAGVQLFDDVMLYHPVNGEPVTPVSERGILMAKNRKYPLTEVEEVMLENWERPVNEMFGEWVFVPSDGISGSGKRVWKCFPVIDNWTAEATFVIFDDLITEDVFRKVLFEAGFLIGVGRWRIRNKGMYGSFKSEILSWTEKESA